jgi:phospholipase/carboxylesterase
MPLDFIEKLPKTGKPSKIVLLIHGYGSNMHDLIALAPELEEHFQDFAYVSINGYQPFEGDPSGHARQWFSLVNRDEDVLYHGLELAYKRVGGFIQQQLERFDLKYTDVILMGFSQGCMLSLHTALKLPENIAGVVGFSGALVGAGEILPEANKQQRICLIHGIEDNVVPHELMLASASAMNKVGISVEQHSCKHLAHGISLEGMQHAIKFIKNII